MNPIPAFERKVNRLEFRIAKLKAQPEKTVRTRRIERLGERLETALNNAPQDTFEITYKAPTEDRSFYRFEVDILDSPYDDTFTGGDPVLLNVRATGRRTQWGTSGRNMTTALANGDYWDGSDEQTLMVGGSGFDFTGHETATATLAIDTRDWSGVGSNMGDVLAVQTFDM